MHINLFLVEPLDESTKLKYSDMHIISSDKIIFNKHSLEHFKDFFFIYSTCTQKLGRRNKKMH